MNCPECNGTGNIGGGYRDNATPKQPKEKKPKRNYFQRIKKLRPFKLIKRVIDWKVDGFLWPPLVMMSLVLGAILLSVGLDLNDRVQGKYDYVGYTARPYMPCYWDCGYECKDRKDTAEAMWCLNGCQNRITKECQAEKQNVPAK
jgi:hypothetical protein